VAAYIGAREDVIGKGVHDSRHAAAIAGEKLRRLEHEQFWVAFLNRANVVLSLEMLFKGCLDSVNISHRDVIAKALTKSATGIIVFHNHPSGCPLPSKADIQQTRLLNKACEIMEIGMIDPIIVSPSCYYSFADECTTDF
jgi:DNA repair protein RadC